MIKQDLILINELLQDLSEYIDPNGEASLTLTHIRYLILQLLNPVPIIYIEDIVRQQTITACPECHNLMRHQNPYCSHCGCYTTNTRR